jgi:hypothetical protein
MFAAIMLLWRRGGGPVREWLHPVFQRGEVMAFGRRGEFSGKLEARNASKK